MNSKINYLLVKLDQRNRNAGFCPCSQLWNGPEGH